MPSSQLEGLVSPSLRLRGLSPLLYVLTIGILASNLRASEAIPGLLLPGIAAPLPVVSLHADDTTVITLSDRNILEVFRVYARFEVATRALG